MGYMVVVGETLWRPRAWLSVFLFFTYMGIEFTLGPGPIRSSPRPGVAPCVSPVSGWEATGKSSLRAEYRRAPLCAAHQSAATGVGVAIVSGLAGILARCLSRENNPCLSDGPYYRPHRIVPVLAAERNERRSLGLKRRLSLVVCPFYFTNVSLYGYFLFASSAICLILAPKSPTLASC